jgi:cell wall-associated NlpC family hydrolase
MSRSMIRRALTALAVTGIVAPVLAVVTMAPASAATGVDVANLASANLGLHYCDTNSRGGSGYFTSCKGENWCADFAKWVWQNVGLPVDGLTPESGSFYTYGSRNGTLHTDSGYVPQAGDAVVFNYHGGGDADHVGLVTRVGGDGVIQVINGNFGSDPRTSKVGYSSVRAGSARPSRARPSARSSRRPASSTRHWPGSAW